MEGLTSWLADFVREWLGGVLAAGLGFAGKSAYDYWRLKWKLRHLQNVFGPVYGKPNEIRIVVPKFEPQSTDHFAPEQATRLLKKALVNPNTNEVEMRAAPLFSEVIVADDYRAFKHIDRLFRRYKYGEIDVTADDAAMPDWRTELFICIGGPRSNLKLRQTLERIDEDLLQIHEDDDSLEQFFLRFATPDGPRTLRSTPEKSCGYILKLTNPVYSPGKIIAIAGDSAAATEMTAEYFATHIERISQSYGRGDFIIILGLDRDLRDTLYVDAEYPLDTLTETAAS